MKRIFLCGVLLCAYTISNACSVCGCSASNQYLGILPQHTNHFIGLQYQYRAFESTHADENEPSQPSKEYYQTVQLWGRYSVSKRLQLFAFVPYIYNKQHEPAANSSINGLGDISLLANVRLLGLYDDCGKWNHKLQVGGGIKLPTGSYNATSVATEEGLPNMQPGTKSWDFIVNANYTVSHDNIGANIDASYTLTTANPSNYKYGNRLSAGLLCYYQYKLFSLRLVPQAGLRTDFAGSDYDNYSYRWKNDMSGGYQLYASVGIQAYYKKIGVQAMYYVPAAQHYASGLVTAKSKTEVGIYFLF